MNHIVRRRGLPVLTRSPIFCLILHYVRRLALFHAAAPPNSCLILHYVRCLPPFIGDMPLSTRPHIFARRAFCMDTLSNTARSTCLNIDMARKKLRVKISRIVEKPRTKQAVFACLRKRSTAYFVRGSFSTLLPFFLSVLGVLESSCLGVEKSVGRRAFQPK
jgi:hypothetical protein